MLKYFFIFFALAIVTVVALAGFRGQRFQSRPIEIFPDMDHQPKVKAQKPSDFFADGSATRVPVAGTVPMGYVMPVEAGDQAENVAAAGPYKSIRFSGAPGYFDTGKFDDQWGTGIPFEVTSEILARGRQRYSISCAVCHGATGQGNGITSKYGIVGIANLHQDRFLEMADGEIFNTITHGKNTMMGYGYNIQVQDRWAIVAYVRSLATLVAGDAGRRAGGRSGETRISGITACPLLWKPPPTRTERTHTPGRRPPRSSTTNTSAVNS